MPRGIDCQLCQNFKRDTRARENDLITRLLAEEKRRLMLQFPISKSKRAPKPVPQARMRSKSPPSTARTASTPSTSTTTTTTAKVAQSSSITAQTASTPQTTAQNPPNSSTINATSQTDEQLSDLPQRCARIFSLMLRVRNGNTSMPSTRRAIALPAPSSAEALNSEHGNTSTIAESDSLNSFDVIDEGYGLFE